MPLYEYRCSACGSREERLETLAAPSSHDCPGCGRSLGMERILSAPALALQASAPAPAAGGPPCGMGGGCACPYAG
jgi:putative FmdB family regulatory protein